MVSPAASLQKPNNWPKPSPWSLLVAPGCESAGWVLSGGYPWLTQLLPLMEDIQSAGGTVMEHLRKSRGLSDWETMRLNLKKTMYPSGLIFLPVDSTAR